MNYYIDNDGIHFEFDKPIPDDIAVKTVEAIAARQREALDAIKPSDAAAPVDSREEAQHEPAAAA